MNKSLFKMVKRLRLHGALTADHPIQSDSYLRGTNLYVDSVDCNAVDCTSIITDGTLFSPTINATTYQGLPPIPDDPTFNSVGANSFFGQNFILNNNGLGFGNVLLDRNGLHVGDLHITSDGIFFGSTTIMDTLIEVGLVSIGNSGVISTGASVINTEKIKVGNIEIKNSGVIDILDKTSSSESAIDANGLFVKTNNESSSYKSSGIHIESNLGVTDITEQDIVLKSIDELSHTHMSPYEIQIVHDVEDGGQSATMSYINLTYEINVPDTQTYSVIEPFGITVASWKEEYVEKNRFCRLDAKHLFLQYGSDDAVWVNSTDPHWQTT
jgi:hypothetical protein